MAIKIRCSECSKRISIDEAFSGGVCRCPYCRALVMVPGGDDVGLQGIRPAAPVSRPEAPGATAKEDTAELVAQGGGASSAASEETAERAEPQSVPVAERVRFQGHLAIVLICLLGVMMVIGVIGIIWTHYKNKPAPQETSSSLTEPLNPLVAQISGPSVAGDIPLAGPVVYVLDGGSNMKEQFDSAVCITEVSVGSLGADQKFTILVSLPSELIGPPDHPASTSASKPSSAWRLPENDMMLPGGFIAGGEQGRQIAKAFLEDNIEEEGRSGHGQTDVVATLRAAVGLKPKTIVLYTRKPIEDLQHLTADASKQGVQIITLGLDVDSMTQEALEKLAKDTRGVSRSYRIFNLRAWGEKYRNN